MSLTQRTQRQKARRQLEEKRRIAEMKRRYEEQRRQMLEASVESDEAGREASAGKKRKFILGLLMLPLCLLTLVVFLDLLFAEAVGGDFWKSEGFWFFGFGCLCWWSMNLVRRGEPGLMYVFAHEMTHAIAVRLSGGRVHRIRVGAEGGFVDTDKTNTLITLSPYLVPFYTVVVLAVFGVLSIFVDLDQAWELPWLLKGFHIKLLWVFYFMVGLTWWFHVVFTWQVLETEQSDLIHNGEFFSMMLIIFINLVILILLLVAVSPSVGWREVVNAFRWLWTMWR